MSRLIILNGYPRSGKDTFIKECIKYLLSNYEITDKNIKRNYEYKIKRISTIDTPKRIFRKGGWDGVKTVETRNGLSELKDLLCKYLDFSFYEITESLTSSKYDFVFTAAREAEEINKLVDFCFRYGYNVHTVLVERNLQDEIEKSLENLPHSDKGIHQIEYMHTIDNSGSLEDLREKCIDFCETYLK